MSYSKNNISAMYYTGTVCAYLGSTDQDGWVICDGIIRNVSDSRYANLVTMGIGTGSANVYTPPDYRGAFLRGSNKGTANATAGTTYGARAPDLKSSQTHMTETHSHTASSGNQSAKHTHTVTFNTTGSHNHTGTIAAAGDHTHTLTTDSAGGHTHTYTDYYALETNNGGSYPGLNYSDYDNSLFFGNDVTSGNQSANHTHDTGTTSNQSANHTHTLTIDSNGAHTHTLTTDSNSANHTHSITVSNSTTRAGTETRPYNYGVNWMLKL